MVKNKKTKKTHPSAGDGFDPLVRKIPEGETGNPFQYCCLGNPVDRAACWAIVYGGTKESDGT